MADLAKALAQGPELRWIIGRVKELTGDTFTMTYKGGDVTAVGTLDHYTPAVGDVVHVLSSNDNGMIAIGSNNQIGTPPAIPDPAAPTTIFATGTGTYQVSTDTWTVNAVVGSPDLIGCWFYPDLTTMGLLNVTQFTIRIKAQTADPVEFVLHQSIAATGTPVTLSPSYRVAAPPLGIPTDVPLPIGWAAMLLSGQAMGIGVGGGAYSANLTGSSGLLTFTPL